ncbi:hypothetical protein DFJ58DRAFT_846948 [Suillus subalutaceus]|uniref:uncharacterized protein n=1 Tax=Suillus subalutaceus TaxID=48586 RepID=UPI001B866650|nr:uncharacterized protein DFJ58DRAFT_846948 [Suillus subalutaceus]KAG1836472.1 hypothetical protein DFJ58DRAFT_846948 [Suillus subalutaceus]
MWMELKSVDINIFWCEEISRHRWCKILEKNVFELKIGASFMFNKLCSVSCFLPKITTVLLASSLIKEPELASLIKIHNIFIGEVTPQVHQQWFSWDKVELPREMVKSTLDIHNLTFDNPNFMSTPISQQCNLRTSSQSDISGGAILDSAMIMRCSMLRITEKESLDICPPLLSTSHITKKTKSLDISPPLPMAPPFIMATQPDHCQ